MDDETRFARGEYIIGLEPVERSTGAWSVRVTVTHERQIVRAIDLSKEIEFPTRGEALAHGSQLVDELVRALGQT